MSVQIQKNNRIQERTPITAPFVLLIKGHPRLIFHAIDGTHALKLSMNLADIMRVSYSDVCIIKKEVKECEKIKRQRH